jgi:hypothetical protein
MRLLYNGTNEGATYLLDHMLGTFLTRPCRTAVADMDAERMPGSAEMEQLIMK